MAFNLVVKYFFIILLLSTLSTFFLFGVQNGLQKQYCPTEYLSQTEETEISSWLQYGENWNGEILIHVNSTKNEIVFTDDYQIRMISKGFHPLCMKYEHYYKRIERIEKYCGAFASNSHGVYAFTNGPNAVMFNDETKLLHCTVPKVSSYTWTTLFINLLDFNLYDYINPYDDMFAFLKQYSKRNETSLIYSSTDKRLVAKRFQTYTKFLITRNPFERLLSAYTNKFQSNNLAYEYKYGPKIIIANYLSHLTKDLIETVSNKLNEGETNLGLEASVIQQIVRLGVGEGNYNITFGEFLNFIIQTVAESGIESLDYHWVPITIVCNPCTVRYDLIVKFETLYEDSQEILDYAQTNVTHDKVQFPKRDHLITKDRCNEAFLNIPRDVRNKLHELFKEDFILFDYKYNGENSNNEFC